MVDVNLYLVVTWFFFPHSRYFSIPLLHPIPFLFLFFWQHIQKEKMGNRFLSHKFLSFAPQNSGQPFSFPFSCCHFVKGKSDTCILYRRWFLSRIPLWRYSQAWLLPSFLSLFLQVHCLSSDSLSILSLKSAVDQHVTAGAFSDWNDGDLIPCGLIGNLRHEHLR